MNYGIRHTCGHSSTVTLFGPGKERDRKREWLEGRPCNQCTKAATADRAIDQTDTRDLPPLNGSDKQVEWATRCRYHALILIDRVIAEAGGTPDTIALPASMILPGETSPRYGDVIARLYEQDSARFWIDHAKDAHQAWQRILEDGIESNRTPTAIVAGLLLAAAGVTDAPDRHLGMIMDQLTPSAETMRSRTHGATLEAHVTSALATIRRALQGKQRPYIAYSGGKDSAAVLALVLSVRPDVTIHWSDDELEYPETVAQMARMQEQHGDQFVISQGWAEHGGWFRPWVDRPFWRDPLPGTLVAGMDSDDWMASRGHDLTFLGTRADESKVRRQWLEANGPIYRVSSGTGVRCCPIWDWPTDYVYLHLKQEGVTLNPVYDRLQEIGVELERRRVGPLPLVPRDTLVNGWPDLYDRLVARYGDRWQ